KSRGPLNGHRRRRVMCSMIIDTTRLGEQPEPKRVVFRPDWLARELEGVIHAELDARGEADLLVTLLGSKVQVTGEIRAEFTVPCARCLEPAAVTMNEPFLMIFEEAPAHGWPEELELTEEDLHWESYNGREIDLAPLLREQLILAVPMTPLCRPDCDGLVAQAPRAPDFDDDPGDGPGDPRWNALAKVRPKG
ncbi:MAG: DUF177 domain-containing protein, partial [bacterium]